MKLNLW